MITEIENSNKALEKLCWLEAWAPYRPADAQGSWKQDRVWHRYLPFVPVTFVTLNLATRSALQVDVLTT